MNLKENIEQFLKENIEISKDINSNETTLMDPIFGNIYLFNYEACIVDTLFFNRLQYVSQMGVVKEVFPNVQYNRFSHSIGVLHTAGKILEHLQNHYPRLIDERAIKNVRLSALLHDIGHGPFSHFSEKIMLKFDDMKNEKKKDLFIDSAPHEIIAWHMINSNTMRKFLNNLMLKFDIVFDIDEIANYVIGKTRNLFSTRYIAEIINGVFDADKLDYMLRDAGYIGFKSPLEIDSLIRSLKIIVVEGYTKKRYRTIGISEDGIDNIMDLIFHKLKISRIILNPKVRSFEKMLFEIFIYVIQHRIPINGVIINSSVDLLKINEYDIYKISNTGNRKIDQMIEGVSTRTPYSPSLIISDKSIINIGNKPNISLLKFLNASDSTIDYTRTKISEEIGGECSKYDILIDISKYYSSMGSFLMKVYVREKDGTIVELEKSFSYSVWLMQYMKSVWKAYIFSSPKYSNKAAKASKKVLEELFGLKFNKYSMP